MLKCSLGAFVYTALQTVAIETRVQQQVLHPCFYPRDGHFGASRVHALLGSHRQSAAGNLESEKMMNKPGSSLHFSRRPSGMNAVAGVGTVIKPAASGGP